MTGLLLDFTNMELGLITTVLGFGIVFVVLIVICVILMGFSKTLSASVEQNKAIVAAPKTNAAPSAAATYQSVDDKELIAVITAAIAASMGGNVSPDRLVVRSLRRVRRSGWKTEAIHEQQNNII